MNKGVITRFAPSPTGFLHAGNYRTAVFAYLFARHAKGAFVLRIEDTDRIRSKKEYEDNILECLNWLTLEHDAFYRQSDHVNRHRELLERLISEDKAYLSKEADEEGKRGEVIRFRNPKKLVTFVDAIRGPITVDTTDLGDFVIAKALDEPVFHFVVVVDDFDEGISHVIRGEDHISNTPRQILIQEALGFSMPIYAHLPLVIGKDRTKLSKRRGAKPLLEYRNMGILSDALLNYIALLGWNPGTPQEIFSKENLIESFSLEKIQRSPGMFDEEKLRWVNKKHIELLSDEEIKKNITPLVQSTIANSAVVISDIKTRISAFSDVTTLAHNGEFDVYTKKPTLEPKKLPWRESNPEKTKHVLRETIDILKKKEGAITIDSMKETLSPLVEKEGKGAVLWPIRYALSGKDRSPDPYTLLAAIEEIYGRGEVLARLEAAHDILLG